MPPTQICKNVVGRDAAHLTAIDFCHASINLLGPSLVVSGIETAWGEFGISTHKTISPY